MAVAADGFRPLDEKSVMDYIKATPTLRAQLGNQLDGLTIKEVGDGNLNFVYIVVGPAGSLVIKQVIFFGEFLACLWFLLRWFWAISSIRCLLRDFFLRSSSWFWHHL